MLANNQRSSKLGEPTSLMDRVTLKPIVNDSKLDIFRITGGAGQYTYVIPIQSNFSSVVVITVWNPDVVAIEKVIKTFTLIK
jgi:hypothetical protein